MDLIDFFRENPKVALAFSGGVDSAFLWYAAKRYGAQVKAYYCRTPFQPQFEFDDVLRLAKELEGDFEVISLNVLEIGEVNHNPKNRCYFCKKALFSALTDKAKRDGYSVIIDGTNASDDAADRPGMLALKELAVRSPLRECGLTKVKIRELSKEAGLFTWNKPAYACLATRVPAGEPITMEKLSQVENGETFLRNMGFSDFRVRLIGNTAKLQLRESQMEKLMENRREILKELKKIFPSVLLDLEARNEQ